LIHVGANQEEMLTIQRALNVLPNILR